MKLVLASRSPRRKALLEAIGIRSRTVPSGFDEACLDANGLAPCELVVTLAKQKVANVASDYSNDLVLGADTIVVLNNNVLGKPKDNFDAKRMLEILSGKTHQVYTGIALYEPATGKIFSDVDCSYVTMRELAPSEIQWYVGTGEPMGKAGGYAIQGKAALFITEIKGDYTGVVGLPLSKFYEILKQAKVEITSLFI